MFESIFSFILLWFISFIPIMLWGYFFGYIDNDGVNKARFFLWILAGWLSVFPVLYLWQYVDVLGLQFLNIFQTIHSFSGGDDILGVFISFLWLLFIFSCIPFLFFYVYPISQEKLLIYLKRFWIFSWYFACISVFFYFLNVWLTLYGFSQTTMEVSVSFSEIIFNSVKLVIFYYLLIGILEELSKFLFFSYGKKFYILSSQQWVIYAIFIALWFAFIENILYFQSLYQSYGWGRELISTYFLRNIFSVFLHILCSSIFAYYFSLMYLKFKNNYNLQFIRMMFVGFLLAILFHACFDLFLTFNLTIFIFLYIIGWYFYLTYIFYKE